MVQVDYSKPEFSNLPCLFFHFFFFQLSRKPVLRSLPCVLQHQLRSLFLMGDPAGTRLHPQLHKDSRQRGSFFDGSWHPSYVWDNRPTVGARVLPIFSLCPAPGILKKRLHKGKGTRCSVKIAKFQCSFDSDWLWHASLRTLGSGLQFQCGKGTDVFGLQSWMSPCQSWCDLGDHLFIKSQSWPRTGAPLLLPAGWSHRSTPGIAK